MLGKYFGPERVEQLEYFIRYLPRFDWQFLFVVGIFLGSLVAALTSGSFKWQGVPDMWAERFGTNPANCKVRVVKRNKVHDQRENKKKIFFV